MTTMKEKGHEDGDGKDNWDLEVLSHSRGNPQKAESDEVKIESLTVLPDTDKGDGLGTHSLNPTVVGNIPPPPKK